MLGWRAFFGFAEVRSPLRDLDTVDPAAAAELPLEAMGPAGISGAAKTRRGPAVGLEHGQVGPWPVASESEPRAGDRAATALLRRARPAEPVRRLTQPLNPPNRRIRDPYVRWCGRAGAARFPPIPISAALNATRRLFCAMSLIGQKRT